MRFTLELDKLVDYLEGCAMALATLTDAPLIENAGFTFRPLAVPSRGSVELAVWALEVEPGACSERHSVDREEVFLLQEGRVVVEVGVDEHEPDPGDAVIVAPHTPLRLRNTGDVPARLTVCTSKGIRGIVDGAEIDPPWAQ
jgi:quercetin dioxygenase-like cupin family protein